MKEIRIGYSIANTLLTGFLVLLVNTSLTEPELDVHIKTKVADRENLSDTADIKIDFAPAISYMDIDGVSHTS